jgi:hypothetical protein
LTGTIMQNLANFGNTNINRSRLNRIFPTPDLIQQPFPRNNLSGMEHQML